MGHAPQFLENIVILCFERRFSKQNSVIRQQSNILASQQFLGWLRHCPLGALTTMKGALAPNVSIGGAESKLR